jgi:hypothetical protein
VSIAGIKAILALVVYKIIIWLVKLNLYPQIYPNIGSKREVLNICQAMSGNNFGNKKSLYIAVKALSFAPPIVQSCSRTSSFSGLGWM